MTTRSGASYHTAETVRNHMADEERNELAAAATMGDLLRFLAESQERRAADEGKKGNAGTRRRDEERKRSDAEDYRRSGYGERRASDSWRSWRECSSG